MRLSISELTTYRWTFDQDLHEYANSESNISAVGIWRQKLDDYGTEAAINLVVESGIAVSSLTWAGGFTGADVHSYPEAINDGIDAIRMAAALGAGCLIVYTGPRAGHTHNHAWRLAVHALNELAVVASHLGVTLAIEPTRGCCADVWTFLNDVDATLRLMDKVRGGEIKLVYDTYHLAHENFDPRRIASISARTALVQLSDSNGWRQENLRRNEPSRCHLGHGTIPIADVVAAFELHGYQGFYEVEVLGPAVEGYGYHERLRDARTFYDDLGVTNSRQTRRSLPRT